MRLWDVLPAGLAVINGVVGNTTLQALHLDNNTVTVENRQMVGDVLGRLIAVPSALTFLTVAYCDLSDVGLRPLFQALPGNTNLRLLFLWGKDESCTSEFAAEVLEAVRQNTLLRSLGLLRGKFPELDAAVALVSQRWRKKHA